MKVVGITGPTGAGKTTIGNLIRQRGYTVIDCDKMAASVMDTDKELLQQLQQTFADCFDNSKLNRKKLSKLVFSSPTQLQKLNAIVNPAIMKKMQDIIGEQTGDILFFDGATLLQSGCSVLCRQMIAVLAQPQNRLQRICKRDGLSEQLAAARMNSQPKNEYYRDLCDYIIYTDISDESTREQLNTVLKEVL